MPTVAPTPYPVLLDVVRRVFGAHAAVLFMPEESGRFIALAADCPDNTVKAGAPIEPGKGLVGWIMRKREPLIVNGFDQHGRLGYYDPREESRVTAFMGCPLDNGGVLCVDAILPQSFSEEHMEGLTALGSLFAQPVPESTDTGDVRLYFTLLARIQELRAQNQQWKTYLPAFLKLVAEATGFDHAAFAARPENNETTYIIEAENAPLLLDKGASPQLAIAGSLAGWVLGNDMPVHIEGLGGPPPAALYGKIKGVPDFRSAVCLPVTVNRGATAALCLGGLEPRSIPQAMRGFIRMAVDELAQFLETLYLRHRVRMLLPQAKSHNSSAV